MQWWQVNQKETYENKTISFSSTLTYNGLGILKMLNMFPCSVEVEKSTNIDKSQPRSTKSSCPLATGMSVRPNVGTCINKGQTNRFRYKKKSKITTIWPPCSLQLSPSLPSHCLVWLSPPSLCPSLPLMMPSTQWRKISASRTDSGTSVWLLLQSPLAWLQSPH